MEELMRASHKLAQEVYKNVQHPPDAAQAAKEPEAAGTTGSSAGGENVIDADFEVKD
jgi:hypothetical protein